MKLSIGSPPFEIYVVADTGSTLLWTQCEPCVSCFIQKHPKFNPRKSSTYSKLSCAAQECNIVNEAGTYSCSPDDQELCNYNYTYIEESMTQGVLGKDTITLTSNSGSEESTTRTLKNVVFGCGYNNSGVFSDNEMGVAGLGVGKMSLISQMGPYVGGRKFSQCLVPFDDDHHPSSGSAGKVRFGKGSEVLGEGVVTTPLVTKDGRNQYFVTVNGISVADKFVPYYNKSYEDEFLISKGTWFWTLEHK